MLDPVVYWPDALFLGIGATAFLDLCGVLLQRFFGFPPPDYRLVGRWILSVPAGRLRHADISSSPPRRREGVVGWIGHYLIGVLLASGFIALAGETWLRRPEPLRALAYGVVTVLLPYLVMQPLFGLGIAASRSANPRRSRLRSLINHATFGVGLYLAGLLALGLPWT